MLKTRLALDSVQCNSFQLLTSLPPKRHPTSSLEAITFVVRVEQYRLPEATRLPAAR